MPILSITISVDDKKLFYIKKSVEEGIFKFSCHHFTFDADNHAELTLDENGAIKTITPCKKSVPAEQTNVSSRAVGSNVATSKLKFLESSTASIVIIDAESFLHREVQSITPSLPASELEEKLIISMEKLEEGLQLHVEKLEAELVA